MYTLYIKTHNKTGLKYLGYTSKDPYTYIGSGIIWNKHLKKYGVDISTEVLLQSELKEDIVSAGIHYSKLWDVVKSNDWANLTEERGDGGAIWTGRSHTSDSKRLMSEVKLGKKFSDEHKQKLSEKSKERIGERNNFYGHVHSDESKLKMSKSLTGKTRSEAFKKNLSDRYKGIKRGPMSEETKRKISESKKSKGALKIKNGTLTIDENNCAVIE